MEVGKGVLCWSRSGRGGTVYFVQYSSWKITLLIKVQIRHVLGWSTNTEWYAKMVNRVSQSHRVAVATFWRTFHHDCKISPGEWGGGGCTHYPFHSIYHHEQSYSIHSSWEGRYTPPLTLCSLWSRHMPLLDYVLFGDSHAFVQASKYHDSFKYRGIKVCQWRRY